MSWRGVNGPGSLVDERRVQPLNRGRVGPGPVLYWMHREHRVRDNWGLFLACEEARRLSGELAVCWCLASGFPGSASACRRHYGFLVRGLEEVRADLEALRVPFIPLQGRPYEEVAALALRLRAALVVTDFDSLRPKRRWLDQAAEALECPLIEVDSRNVVPCRAASDKREYAARTIRPKIHRLLPEFLTPMPELTPQERSWDGPAAGPGDLLAALDRLNPDPSVPETAALPGEAAARARLDAFLDRGLDRYAAERNDPNLDATSGLSPYLHYGMLSAQRVVLETLKTPAGEGRDSFIEELVVRRELADNFCFHAQNYDSLDCFPDWALRTLDAHRDDPRPTLYDLETLEAARTADPLWNAAQTALVRRGTMHGYLRMYWAKKILEWSPSPEEAMARALRLNDRYFLDGREANGYAGIAWSIGGVHDRPWKERPVFGQIRYMNLNGARRKFDVRVLVERELGRGQASLL